MLNIFDSNILSREKLELYFELNAIRIPSEFELFVSKLNTNGQQISMMLDEDSFIRDNIIIEPIGQNSSVVLLYPLKQTHIANLRKQGRDHPVALKLAVQKLLAETILDSYPEHKLTILNLSYDPKRRRNDKLFQEIEIDVYDSYDTKLMINNLLDFDRSKQPAACTELQWYKDGGRNRRIKCELCPFNKQCKYFDTNYDAMQKILSF